MNKADRNPWLAKITRHDIKTNKTEKHNTICIGHHYTQDEDKKKPQHNTIHYTQTNTNNVNKT